MLRVSAICICHVHPNICGLIEGYCFLFPVVGTSFGITLNDMKKSGGRQQADESVKKQKSNLARDCKRGYGNPLKKANVKIHNP